MSRTYIQMFSASQDPYKPKLWVGIDHSSRKIYDNVYYYILLDDCVQ